ncbi:hypothetical protein IH799_08880 [candidate division KSB1 bacterium]|nr:hypothetical protein [candidate division KSB1 bacterium]
MMKILVLALIFNSVAIIPYASSQSEAAVLFLLSQPSLRANGMAAPPLLPLSTILCLLLLILPTLVWQP